MESEQPGGHSSESREGGRPGRERGGRKGKRAAEEESSGQASPRSRRSKQQPKLTGGNFGLQTRRGESSGELEASVDCGLWHACAGPLREVPLAGSLVVYFPQGHLEEIAGIRAGPQVTEEDEGAGGGLCEGPQIENRDKVPPFIICRVIEATFRAERITEELYASVTLQPLQVPEEVEKLTATMGDTEESPSSQPACMFRKVLTASDATAHSGFSVPRRAAESVFPRLPSRRTASNEGEVSPGRAAQGEPEASQGTADSNAGATDSSDSTNPNQELIATDFQRNEWRFRHIFRGKPLRHLLTSGWSPFVQEKGVAHQDTLFFVRDDNENLHVGIKRAPHRVVDSAVRRDVPSPQEVLRQVARAARAYEPFTVLHFPRTAARNFIVPYSKFKRGTEQRLREGIPFTTRVEDRDGAAVQEEGTVLEITDLDPVWWPGSPWRSCRVVLKQSPDSEIVHKLSPWDLETRAGGPSQRRRGCRRLKSQTSLNRTTVSSRPKSTSPLSPVTSPEILPREVRSVSPIHDPSGGGNYGGGLGGQPGQPFDFELQPSATERQFVTCNEGGLLSPQEGGVAFGRAMTSTVRRGPSVLVAGRDQGDGSLVFRGEIAGMCQTGSSRLRGLSGGSSAGSLMSPGGEYGVPVTPPQPPRGMQELVAIGAGSDLVLAQPTNTETVHRSESIREVDRTLQRMAPWQPVSTPQGFQGFRADPHQQYFQQPGGMTMPAQESGRRFFYGGTSFQQGVFPLAQPAGGWPGWVANPGGGDLGGGSVSEARSGADEMQEASAQPVRVFGVRLGPAVEPPVSATWERVQGSHGLERLGGLPSALPSQWMPVYSWDARDQAVGYPFALTQQPTVVQGGRAPQPDQNPPDDSQGDSTCGLGEDVDLNRIG